MYIQWNPNYFIEKTTTDSDGIHIIISKVSNEWPCPLCKKPTSKRQDLITRSPKQWIMHYRHPLHRQIVYLYPEKKYFRCEPCASSFMEERDILSPQWKHSKLFATQIFVEIAKHGVKQTAEKLGIKPRRIYNIIKHLDPTWLIMDHTTHTTDIVLSTISHINRNNKFYEITTNAITQHLLICRTREGGQTVQQWYDQHKENTNILWIDQHISTHHKQQRKNTSHRLDREIDQKQIKEFQKQKKDFWY